MYQSNFIPIRPISVNECHQGRRFKTKEFKKWQEAVIYSLPYLDEFAEKKTDLGVRITAYLKSPTVRDIDNLVKPILDCIVKRGVIKDDRYINYLEVIKKKNKKEGFEIEIF